MNLQLAREHKVAQRVAQAARAALHELTSSGNKSQELFVEWPSSPHVRSSASVTLQYPWCHGSEGIYLIDRHASRRMDATAARS